MDRNDLTRGPLPEHADVVVVGGGAAGCVLAARLSENPDRTVLLVEAGDVVSGEEATVPARALEMTGGPAFHDDLTVPQAALGGRQVPFPSGRCLGGGSTVNTMSWFQGLPQDYDGWAAAGASGWAWEDVLPVLRRIEHHPFGPSEFHGSDGPITISLPPDVEELHVAFVAAAERAGLTVSRDLNGAVRHGVGLVQANVRDGRRDGTVQGYLEPALGRANLAVRTGAAVSRVRFSGRRAVGIEVGDEVVRADRVVLAAGAVRTPQVLMVSGVGPEDHLREHGVPVVHHSPGVGANLHDHPRITPRWPVRGGRTLLDSGDEYSLTAYRTLRRGPLASLSRTVAMIPLVSPELPDMQVFPTFVGFGPDLSPLPDPAVTAVANILAPRSRGTIRLRSASVADAPLIDPAYLSDPEDGKLLRAGLHRLEEIVTTPPLRDVCGPREVPSSDDGDLDAFVRSTVATFWHPVGTARMGTDDAAVVDPALAVGGVENLFVCDASVMPAIVRGNTQAATLVIAERGAQSVASSF